MSFVTLRDTFQRLMVLKIRLGAKRKIVEPGDKFEFCSYAFGSGERRTRFRRSPAMSWLTVRPHLLNRSGG